ncbi:MAG: V-type ATP synthase subunit A [Candidatus Methylarchaceae archaeon HK02M1]|nr:V-type ATP synthase subunit A [Candidatus Methylarchaceae archaeon HK01M]MCP8311672.1 V-type ATP synthase subunit A [Candidatus Methylarchaceae archaeon HK02M1]
MRKGEIERITGSVIITSGIEDISIGEVVEVGEEGLVGETIRIDESGKLFTVQVYETTSGIKPGEKVVATSKRLVAELGPGLLNRVFDGVERPLEELIRLGGPLIGRGIKVNSLSRKAKWLFKPTVKPKTIVNGGDIIGEVDETQAIKHKILVPIGVKGEVIKIEEGEFHVDDDIAVIQSNGEKIGLKMLQEWPVRIPRPSSKRLPLTTPLITGQRVIDTFFPVSKGGAASIPGGFGTGKTVMLHQLAKWSEAQVVTYIGCGERGNEMCEVLTDFPELKDPRTGRPLMERTLLIANTSNMPVSAREASIYMGVTMAEYYRDMGYDVGLMADSTSRWAEALREISGRLEEMPVEQGYPAYLPDRVAEFYERAGRVKVLGKPEREGSLTIMGAVSPPGGDFNEPVTIYTLRFTGVFWALDAELAYSRHFPAINWLRSYSLYSSRLGPAEDLSPKLESISQYSHKIVEWWRETFETFPEYRSEALTILSAAAEIESIARIIGESALPDDQRLTLLTAELLKEGFLRQHAYHEVDAFCETEKQALLLRMMIDFHNKARNLILSRVPIERIRSLPQISRMIRVKEDKEGIIAIEKLMDEVSGELNKIASEYKVW